MTDTATLAAQLFRKISRPHPALHRRRVLHSVDGDWFDGLERGLPAGTAGKKADIDLAVAAARRAFVEGPWPRMLPGDDSYPPPDAPGHRGVRERPLAELKSWTGAGSRGPGAARGREFPLLRRTWSWRRPMTPTRCPAGGSTTSTASRSAWPGSYTRGTRPSCSSPVRGPPLPPATPSVLKPAEFTPLSASLWAGIFGGARLPKASSTW